MRVPSTPSTVSIDQAWSDLRRHLEWTRNEPTVVMVAAQTRAQTQDLKERAALWCRRAHEPWSEPEAEQTLLSWLSRHLPVPGVLFLDLWDERVRRRVLHALNEMRIRLARPGGGCVIVCGPIALLSDAAREAADLWSIRSLTCVIGSGSGEMMDLPQRREEDYGSGSLGADDGSRYRSTWSITVPPDQRTPELAATIRETDRARRLLPAEPVKAREILDALPENPSPLASTLRGLTGAEIGGLLDDVVTVEMKLKMVLGNLAQLPPSFRRQTADTALMIAMTFGAVDAAGAAAQELVRFARGLEEVLGTPEARRGLSVAWNNLGRAAQARGDWAGWLGLVVTGPRLRLPTKNRWRSERSLRGRWGHRSPVVTCRWPGAMWATWLGLVVTGTPQRTPTGNRWCWHGGWRSRWGHRSPAVTCQSP